MANLWHDLKHSLRSLFKNPGFTIAAVAALALGIGTNTAIFTVVNTVLLKPLTYPDADRIVQFLLTSPEGKGAAASPTKFNNWRQQTSVLQDVAAYDFGGPGFNLTGDHPEQVHGIHVSEAYFRLFGAPVMLGRTFTPQEDSPNGGKVVVISYGLWQRKFGGNPNIVGSALSLGNEPYTIVGVLGQSFVSDPEADIWLPFQIDPNSTNQGHFFLAAGRLKPGVTLAQANAQLNVAADQFRRRYPEGAMGPKEGFAVEPLRDSIVSDVRSSLFVLLGAVSLVLLIACANVANLLLVRASGRKREFAIRVSMGATRGRIIRQLLVESVLLAIHRRHPRSHPRLHRRARPARPQPRQHPAHRRTRSLRRHRLARPRLHPRRLAAHRHPLRTVPRHRRLASRPQLDAQGKQQPLRHRIPPEQSPLPARHQRSLARARPAHRSRAAHPHLPRLAPRRPRLQPAQRPHHGNVPHRRPLPEDRRRRPTGRSNGRERINAIPGVEASASTCCLPLEGGFGLPFNVVGRPLGKDPYTGGAGWMNTSPGYFDVFKIPILRGRDFKDSDTTGAPGVVLINESMAKKYWPKENPVGQQIIIGKGVGPQFEEPARQIIGVVGDIRDGGLNRDPRPLMIIPQAQVPDGMTALNASIGPVVWLVRTHTDPHQFMTSVPEQLRQASGGFPVARVRSMEEVVVHSTAREDFNMLLLTIFGASALILAAIGIYGLMAYSVQQRTQEMGIRMALGADRARIRNLVVWQGMQLALIGAVIGVAAAFALTRFIASFLFGVKPYDPIVFVTVPVILSAVALFAVWLPATRASKLDPMESLRVE